MPVYYMMRGTGLIATYLVKSLREKGRIVRTTVREPDEARNVGFLLDFDEAKERLKIFKVYLLREGSIVEVVDGVDGVFHTASHVRVPYDDNIMAYLRKLHDLG